MAHLIAVANQKGGCGKTTTAMNLAGGLQKAGYRVLVVDADPQASATIWSLAQGQGSLPFDVIPSRQLKSGIATLLASTEHDIVLFDCPPGVAEASASSNVARMAIRAADLILVPLRPSTLDFSAAATFVRYLSQERQQGTRTLVLVNGKRNTLLDRGAQLQASVLFAPIEGAVILETTIGLRAPITEVSGSGKTIFDYAAGNHEAVREYLNLTREIIQWLTNAPASTLSTSQTSTNPSLRASA